MKQVKFIKPMKDIKTGKVEFRTMKRTGKSRLRFLRLAPDYLEMIVNLKIVMTKNTIRIPVNLNLPLVALVIPNV